MFKKWLPFNVLYAILPLVLPIIFLHLYIYHPSPEIANRLESCDYGDGEWVTDDSGSGILYNGIDCETIKQGQNCMVSGRPDRDYLRWRWMPNRCDLPWFDPKNFLNLVENKNIAFVGDSLARNQMESLLCMASTVEKPHLLYVHGDDNKFRKWRFLSNNSTVSIYWSPFLVWGVEKSTEHSYNTVFLDSIDKRWGSELKDIDILIMSIGHWFLHPALYYYDNSLFGCHYHENCTETGFYDSFRRALKTTFEEIIRRHTEKDLLLLLTTFSPAHFEGEWDKLGSCSRALPYKRSEQILEGMNAEMRKIGVEQVKEAGKRSGEKVSIEVLDVTELSLLRPDGHPGPYMHPFPFENGVRDRVQNDCVHWCLPGPIDTWNQILLDIISKRSKFSRR